MPSAVPEGGFTPMNWSTGTRTQGQATQGQATGPSGGAAGAPAAVPADRATLEARCAALENDVQSLALFARTLLTMLEERNVVTRAQFDETKHRLDMLDGKLDDR